MGAYPVSYTHLDVYKRQISTEEITPAIDKGSVTLMKVMNGVSPRSRPASRKERSIFSSATKIGRIAKLSLIHI